MKALYKSAPGPGHLSLENRPAPVLNETDNVLIRVRACAVCGMDHRIFHGSYPCTPPFIMGHELIGTVEKVLNSTAGRPCHHSAASVLLRCLSCLSVRIPAVLQRQTYRWH